MLIDGKWFVKGSAAHIKAALLIDGDYYQLQTSDGISKQGDVTDVSVSDRLGNVERKLIFEDGSVFATADNDAIDEHFKSVLKANRFIHAIESNLSFVAFALVLTIAVSFSFFKWGLPAASSVIADALPQKTNMIIGSHTLDFLDKAIFDDTKLSEQRQTEIRQHFHAKLTPIEQDNEELTFVLHFRAWGDDDQGIPNALALPSGDVILTDKFIELSQNQNEIDAVLLHEMAHIVERHSLKMLVQATLVTTVIMMTTGDLSGVADLGVGLGSLMLSSNYSRNHESEADQYAFDKMLELGIDPISFANIMRRITDYSESLSQAEEIDEEATSNDPELAEGEKVDFVPPAEEKSESSVLDYFSSHPNTENRAQQAERYSECFQQGLKVCE